MKEVGYKAHTQVHLPLRRELPTSIYHPLRSLLGPLGLELSLKSVNALLQLSNIALELLILSLEVINVALLRGAKAALEVDGILGLLRLLIEADEDLGKLVDDARLLEELAELLFLLFSSLCTHSLFSLLLYYFKI